jgi:hypothetical protein
MSGFASFLRGVFGAPTDPTGPPERVEAVQGILTELRPMFKADGGDILLLSVDEEGGAGSVTLYGAILPRLQEGLEWVTELRQG